MQITSKVHQKALELGLSAKAVSNLDLLDLFTLIYQKYDLYIEVFIETGSKFMFKAALIKLNRGAKLYVDQLKEFDLNTCSLIEAYENAFIETVNYIQNELGGIKN